MKPLHIMKECDVLLLLLAVCFFPVTATAQKEPQELVVFAGAGMNAPLIEVGIHFKKQYGVKVLYDFEGSGVPGDKILSG